MKKLGLLLLLSRSFTVRGSVSPCDVNHDGLINVVDVQIAVNQALGLSICTSDLDGDGKCGIADVQRIIDAVLSGTCNASLPTGNGPAAGLVHFVRGADSTLDPYTAAPSPALQDWMRQHFWRMTVYAPYFNTKLSWYPNGWVYLDSYAIYKNSALVSQHPEWILKDSAGNRLYIPWGCSNDTCPQYAGDISDLAFRQWWTSQAQDILAQGYKGLYIDDVNMEFRVGNGAGLFVNPIDPHTGKPMTWDNWRRYMAEFTEQIRNAFPNVEIVHNSIWYAGPTGIRDLDPYIQRQIAAADYQNIEHGVNDSGLTGGTGSWSLNSLLGYIDRLHAAGKGVIIDGVAADSTSREYALANYYLVSTGSDALGNTLATPDNWWSGFDTNLGTPSAPRRLWNGLLRRDFSGGIVLVNPPPATVVTTLLPGSFQAIAGGPIVTSVTLGPTQGVILRSLK